MTTKRKKVPDANRLQVFACKTCQLVHIAMFRDNEVLGLGSMSIEMALGIMGEISNAITEVEHRNRLQ